MSIYIINYPVVPVAGDDGMYHFVYKTTNTINHKIYIGKHSCANFIKSRYIGSGTALKNSIRKHGRSKFQVEILGFHKSSDDAFEMEEQLVTQEFVDDSSTYNMIRGGKAGTLTQSADSTLRKKNTCMKRYGVDNPKKATANLYEITAPDGTTSTIKNLKQFCKDNDLNDACMRRVYNGQSSNHKGYVCKVMNRTTGRFDQVEYHSKFGDMWEIIHPSGEREVIQSLRPFCIRHNLNQTHMIATKGGVKKHKGYACIKLQSPLPVGDADHLTFSVGINHTMEISPT